ncbi:MAG: serine/threonine protein kinase [Planctomycetes bacterium]|nr:serine/threonine protein kinase [Planctomycetota bacterium]
MARDDATFDWTLVRTLFERCLELPPAARAELLADSPAPIRDEVAALLAEVETNPGRLDPETSHRALIASAERVLAHGRTIGGYRVLEVLGHGGMSTVYLAEQEHPKRRVALKLLTAVLSSPEALQRFRNEGELLARLQHPGIAQIHAAGVHEERTAMGMLRWPYFVMEYVPGARTLTDHVRAEQLGDREILELFLAICAAVQHAHERGVVHRDLKPQNVLVDEAGNPKVIDFGIARNLAPVRPDAVPEPLTRTGDVIGTLHYMSPEQVRGEAIIDTRSDVHALGVILFELLTGELPFELAGKSLPEIGRILTETEARPLRRLRPDAEQDLELVIGMALGKLPDQRYSTAGALAEDVRRYLDHEPINARPKSLRYQLRMFARRRRGVVASALAVLLVSTVGGISSVVYAVRAHDAERRAVEESRVKDDALQRTFDMAVNTVLALPNRIEGLPRATTIRRKLVEEAAQQLEFIEGNLPIDDDKRFDLARAFFSLGNAQLLDAADAEGPRESVRSFDRSAAYLATILADDPDHRDALHLQADLAFRRGLEAFNENRDMAAAKAFWAAAKAAVDRLDALPPLAGRDLLRLHANHEKCLASIANMERRLEDQIGHLERSRELQLERLQRAPDDIDVHVAIAGLDMDIGLVRSRLADAEQTLACYARAVERLEIAELHPDEAGLRHLRAKARSRYGFALAQAGRAEEGNPHLRWGAHELAELHGRDPDNVYVARSYTLSCSLLAEHLMRRAQAEADTDAARALYDEAAAIAQQGCDVATRILERSRDMQTLFVRGVCSGIVEKCAEEAR